MSNKKTYIDKDGEVGELDADFFERASRGRPTLAPALRKQRVTIMLDRKVIEYFKKEGKGWQTRANAALRIAAGLDKPKHDIKATDLEDVKGQFFLRKTGQPNDSLKSIIMSGVEPMHFVNWTGKSSMLVTETFAKGVNEKTKTTRKRKKVSPKKSA